MTLRKEDITKVFFPNLTGEYYLAIFKNHGYKKVVLAKTKKSFDSVVKYLFNDGHKLDQNKVLPAKIKIISPTEQQKEIAFAYYDKKIDSFLLSFIRDKAEDYYEQFKKLPKGFVPTTVINHPNKVSFYDYKRNKRTDAFITLSKDECRERFFESFDKQLTYTEYKTSDYPKTTDKQSDIKNIYAVYCSSFDGSPEFIEVKDTCFLNKPPMFYFEIAEKLSRKDIFDKEFKITANELHKKIKEKEKEDNLLMTAKNREIKKHKKAELKKLFDK